MSCIVFFSILIVMGLARAPRIEQYWSNNPIYHNEFIVKSGIGRDRFKLIASGVHISNPDPNYQTEAKQEKLKKVHPLYEFLQRKCMMLYTPSESVSIDERMVGSKARVSIIQYIKDKAHQMGIHVLGASRLSKWLHMEFFPLHWQRRN